jgi:hypothetical protein
MSAPTHEHWQKLRSQLGVSSLASTEGVVGRRMFCPWCGTTATHFRYEASPVIDHEYGCPCGDVVIQWANTRLPWYRENGTVTH